MTSTYIEWADEICAIYINVFRLIDQDQGLWTEKKAKKIADRRKLYHKKSLLHFFKQKEKWNINVAPVLHIRIRIEAPK